MADLNATFVQEIFNITERERKPNIKHHSQADDLWARFEVAECGGIHARDKPVRLIQPSLIWQLQAECLPTFDNFLVI